MFENRSKKFLVTVVSFIIFLNIIAPGPFFSFTLTFNERVLGSLIIIFGSLPTAMYLTKKDERVPFMPLFGWVYILYYGLSIFLAGHWKRHTGYLSHPIYEKTLLLVLIGFIMVMVGYYVRPGGRIGELFPKYRLSWNIQKAKSTAVWMGIIGLFTYSYTLFLDIPVQLAQLVKFVTELCAIAILILFILQLNGHLRRREKIFLWAGLIIPRILIGATTGQVYHGFIVMVLLYFTYITFSQRIPIKLSIILCIILFIAMSIKGHMRELTWETGRSSADYSYLKKVGIYLKIAGDFVTGKKEAVLPDAVYLSNLQDVPDWTKGYYEALYLVISRLSGLKTLAVVVESTPNPIPYWKGETYYPLLFKPIPRILYPGKPIQPSGHEFGHKYGLLARDDSVTCYRLPQLVEMYGNFGTMGIVIGMFLTGVIFRLFREMFCHKNAGFGSLLIGIFIFTRLLDVEANFSSLFGGLLYPVLFLFLINKVLLCQNRFE